MPGLSGTGPTGKGPRTGRGFGPCKIVHKSGFLGKAPGGLGRGQGLGLGRGRGFGPAFGFGKGFGPK